MRRETQQTQVSPANSSDWGSEEECTVEVFLHGHTSPATRVSEFQQ